jgi:hypothetical protein
MLNKRVCLTCLLIIMTTGLYAAVNSLSVYQTGYNSQDLEATSVNNPVLHFKINADTGGGLLSSISVKNVLNSYSTGSAGEPQSIAPGSVKIWYMPVDSAAFNAAAAQYVTYLAAASATSWSGTLGASYPVADGSGIWVTVDLPAYPVPATIQFQTDGVVFDASAVTSVNEPASPPVLLVTASTPANSLMIYHSSGSMQSYVSTGQDSILVMKLYFINNSGVYAAPANINSITFTVQNSLSQVLTPTAAIADIKIVDADVGTLYGEVSGAGIPGAAAPFQVPVSSLSVASATVTANVIITIADIPAVSAGGDFSLLINSGADIGCTDFYTGTAAVVSAAPYDSFQMQSAFATIQNKSLLTEFSFDGAIIPSNINKGQTNVTLANLVFTNPGNSLAAYTEVYSLKFMVKDNFGAPIVPKDIFSKISATDSTGAVTYGLKPSAGLEASGNMITMPLPNPVAVAAGASVTVVVRADISPLTAAQDFMIGLDTLADMLSRDKNSLNSGSFWSAQTAPYYTGLAVLSSSFKVSHASFMPQNIYAGQAGVHVMNLHLTSPLSFGNGNILVRGVTLAAEDASSAPINFPDYMTGLHMVSSSGQDIVFSSLPSSSQCYFAFPRDMTVTTGAGETIMISADIKQGASGSLKLVLPAGADLQAYQDNDPGRTVYISALSGDAFPMSSGTGYIGGPAFLSSFSAYPNPFAQGGACRLAYYLAADSKVTIGIYDIMGGAIKEIIKNVDRASGSHNEDMWDGTDKYGRHVLSGTYIVKLEVSASGKTKTSRTRVIFKK